MDIQIKIENLEQLRAAFQRSPLIAAQEYSRALERSAFRIEADAKHNAPVNKQSGGGTLRQSISSRMEGKSTAIVEAKASYAAYVDQGTRPHIIQIRNARVLANRRTGQFFGKIVHHPGTRPTYFFTNAVKDNEPFINNEFSTALNNVLNSIH